MVLIVWSVMGGFLAMLLRSGGTLFGDVTIGGSVTRLRVLRGELIDDLVRTDDHRGDADPRSAGADGHAAATT